MNTRQYLMVCGLPGDTALAFAAIRAGRHAVDSARRAQDARAERAARRDIDAYRKAVREAAKAFG